MQAEDKWGIRLGDCFAYPQLNLIVGPSGEKSAVRPKAMDVLVCLCEQTPAVVSKQELADKVWTGTAVSDAVIAQAVSDLRKVLGDDVKNPKYIQTIPKRGYLLIAPLDSQAEARSAPRKRSAGSRRKVLFPSAVLAAMLLIVLQSGHRPRGSGGPLVVTQARIDADEECQRAVHLLGRRTREGWQSAVRHFEEAIRLDPQFPHGYVGLAEC